LQLSESGFDRRPKPSRTIARCRTPRPMRGGLESRMQSAICSIRCPARTRGSTTNRTPPPAPRAVVLGDAGSHVLPLDRHKDAKLLQRHLDFASKKDGMSGCTSRFPHASHRFNPRWHRPPLTAGASRAFRSRSSAAASCRSLVHGALIRGRILAPRRSLRNHLSSRA
jgi:hypothetical protein